MRVWMRIVGMLGRFYILKETFMDTGALQAWKGFIFGMCNWLHNLSKLTFNYAGEFGDLKIYGLTSSWTCSIAFTS